MDELINKTCEKRAFSGWIMLVLWWAMILFALHASTHMVGAGDTWVAMACGRHFINHGVNTVEPFSANSHRPGPTVAEVKTWPKWAQWITDKVGLDTVKFWHPTGWVNQNWLTHVFFYWLTHDSPIADAETFDKPIEGQNISYNSLVYWKYALYITTIIVVYYTGTQLGANPALSAVFACFALFIGRTFFDIRPAGFSNLLTAALLFIFVLTINRNYLYIWLIVPLTVLWCNLHGGYVYVFLVLVPFIGLHFLMLLPKRISQCLYYAFGWLFLYALAVTFRAHEYLEHIKPLSDGLLYFILAMVAASVVLTILKNVKAALFYMYHVLATFIVFVSVCPRFFPEGIESLIRRYSLFADYAWDSRRSFFVFFAGFVAAAVLLGAFRHKLKTISLKGWSHTVAAAFIAFVAMILANPFRFTNLTHTFVVSLSEDAKMWKTVNEWHPAFEWSNPVGTAIPFLYMYIIAWVLLTLWFVCLLLKPSPVVKRGKVRTELPDNQQYEWPMIDLPLLAIAAITMYMAIGSRRFIPIAAIAACPILAMFLDNTIKMIAALVNLRKTGRAILSPFPVPLQRYFAAAILAVVIFLTVWWGYWYKTIYLNPWPDSDSLTSVFMRMSASYAKPFKACQFIRDNKIRGKVYNYWTEGGFIAYGQFPDPNGKTPLQLFMDGRAQAAYNTDAYQHWMYIMSGGDVVRMIQKTGRAFTPSDYEAVGNWLDEQFRKENVWVVLMPGGQFSSELVNGLEASQSWRPVYMDNEQRLYVDIRTPQGRDIYEGMFINKTKFPDEFSKYFTLGYNLMRIQDKDKISSGGEFMIQALMLKPSPAAAAELIYVSSRYPQLRDQIADVLSQYFEAGIGKNKLT